MLRFSTLEVVFGSKLDLVSTLKRGKVKSKKCSEMFLIIIRQTSPPTKKKKKNARRRRCTSFPSHHGGGALGPRSSVSPRRGPPGRGPALGWTAGARAYASIHSVRTVSRGRAGRGFMPTSGRRR